MAHIFIAYASPDNVFALRLAQDITALGHGVWIDQWEIGIGDATSGKVLEGLERTDYMVVVLSQHTMRSLWVEREVQIKYYEEITERKTIIFPVLIEDCLVPSFLRLKRFADFRLGYEIGLAQLAITLHNAHLRLYKGTVFPPRELSNDFCYTGYMLKNTPRLSELNVEIGIPYIGTISGMWKPSEEEQTAAWEMYIELVTRVSVAALRADEGLLRESLSSLYAIFTNTRDILRKHGPAIAQSKDDNELSFGYLAIHILNFVLRPVLATWHPALLAYEHMRDPAVSSVVHERKWEKADELREVLNNTRLVLIEYTNVLAKVAGVPQLIEEKSGDNHS